MKNDPQVTDLKAQSLPWLGPQLARLGSQFAAGRVPQAVLIHGAPGTGRRALAAWLAARCLQLRPDAAAVAGWPGFLHPDLMVVTLEEEKSQIRIPQVRELIAFLGLTGHRGGTKVALIDPADAMNVNTANALLKTLEEPAHSTLILVARAPSRLPPTVVSRCQQIRVGSPRAAEATDWLRRTAGPRNDWPALLELAGGGPLLALELAAGGADERLAELDADLAALARGAESPVAVGRRWARKDPELLLTGLYLELSRRLRRVLVSSGGNAPLQIGQRAVTMAASFAYLERLTQARRLLDRSLNQELQLADLLMWWFGVQGAAPRGA